MEKIKYIPLGLLVSYSLKALVIGASVGDLGVLAVLTVMSIFYEVKTEQKIIKELRKEMGEMSALAKQTAELHKTAIENLAKQMGELKGFVNSVKLNQTIPGVKFGNGKSNINF